MESDEGMTGQPATGEGGAPGGEPGSREGAPPEPAVPMGRAGLALIIVGIVILAAALLILFAGSHPASEGGAAAPTGPLTVPPTGVPFQEIPAMTSTAGPSPERTNPPPACVPAGPPGFTVRVTPAEASAARGETVLYHMTIEGQNCFSENVTLKLTASVLFILSQTYDLGTQEPPFPKTFEYALRVPDSLFPGATVDGVLTSTGGGITRETRLTLHVK